MGSTGYMISRDPEWNGSTKDFLDKQNTSLPTEQYPTSFKVLASATRYGVYYAAIERITKDGERVVLAAVQPYKFYGKGYERELVVKDQDETMGPFDVCCPKNILDLLTEPLNEYAAQWREKCRKNLGVKRPKVKAGDTLVFASPFTFGRYGQATRFLVTEWGKRKRFIAQGEIPFNCRLSRWALDCPFEVIAKGEN